MFSWPALAIGLALAAAPSELRRFESVEPHMGTLVQVIVYVEDEERARLAFRTAFDRIRDLDAILSDYKSESELSRLAAVPAGRAVPVSDDLFAVLAAAQRLAEATGGAFDVTQGAVVRLWREARKAGQLPDARALEEASARAGYRKLTLDTARQSIALDAEGMALDLGGIAKGYAASEALAALRASGVQHALVAVSGDIALGGAPPGTRGWRIALPRAHEHPANLPDVVELANTAVSTSGSSAQHLAAGGRRYSHIISPADRMGLVNDLEVTVIADHGLDADGLATAISVLGAERGLALAASWRDAAVLVVDRTGPATVVHQSPAFRALVSSAVSSSTQAALDALYWLAGCWQSTSGTRTTTEMWLAPSGGLMIGAGRTVSDGKVREYEHLRLRADGNTLVYTAIPSGQREADFRSTATSAGGFVVENPSHDFPQRITYTRTGERSLTVRVEGTGPRGPRSFELPFERTPCESEPQPRRF